MTARADTSEPHGFTLLSDSARVPAGRPLTTRWQHRDGRMVRVWGFAVAPRRRKSMGAQLVPA